MLSRHLEIIDATTTTTCNIKEWRAGTFYYLDEQYVLLDAHAIHQSRNFAVHWLTSQYYCWEPDTMDVDCTAFKVSLKISCFHYCSGINPKRVNATEHTDVMISFDLKIKLTLPQI
jgi:hypothetical protein